MRQRARPSARAIRSDAVSLQLAVTNAVTNAGTNAGTKAGTKAAINGGAKAVICAQANAPRTARAIAPTTCTTSHGAQHGAYSMGHHSPLSGVLLDEVALTLDELALACQVEPDWVIRHVEAGVLGEDGSVALTTIRFRSGDLARARRLRNIEQAFDANEDIAALVLDLGDEIHRLRTRLRIVGGE